MVIFHSYVKLPEGIYLAKQGPTHFRNPCLVLNKNTRKICWQWKPGTLLKESCSFLENNRHTIQASPNLRILRPVPTPSIHRTWLKVWCSDKKVKDDKMRLTERSSSSSSGTWRWWEGTGWGLGDRKTCPCSSRKMWKYHEISWNIMKYHEISWNIKMKKNLHKWADFSTNKNLECFCTNRSEDSTTGNACFTNINWEYHQHKPHFWRYSGVRTPRSGAPPFSELQPSSSRHFCRGAFRNNSSRWAWMLQEVFMYLSKLCAALFFALGAAPGWVGRHHSPARWCLEMAWKATKETYSVQTIPSPMLGWK